MLRRVDVQAEFTVYPFEEGEAYPPHVQVALEALYGAGLDVQLGPLSQVVTGEARSVLEALRAAQAAAIEAGASRVVVNLEVP
jgi:uncharacterized protein YqgV (UPF0045/DUF77 family)